MTDSKRSLGICIGASTIKVVEMDDFHRIVDTSVTKHDCNPRLVLRGILHSIAAENYRSVTVTGRKLKELVNLPMITEVEATELALKQYLHGTKDSFNALLSLGGENFILYELDKSGTIVNIRTGNKCASGTGDFFMQQLRRMNVGVDEAIAQAHSSTPYRVSGRCSVFCKSDCTHALNKGVSIGRICSGLEHMMADKILELLGSHEHRSILVVGGVSRNEGVMELLRANVANVVVPEHADVFEAVGASLHSLEHGEAIPDEILLNDIRSFFNSLPALKKAEPLVEFKEQIPGVPQAGDECILGLDVGSTTTKAVLLRTRDDAVIASVYLRTNGNPVSASRECYKEIAERLKGTEVNVIGLGVTGSGRQIAALHASTDGIVNEIIAHATGAAHFCEDVDTIIEIGGQDAKYTYLVNGVPCDYAMNEACSAGTGSFLEEASKENLGIDYFDIQDIALRADSPLNFNDQCVAFISSDIKNASHENSSREDIVAGLVYSICMNYNNRVKGSRKLGEKIFMQGGVCYNKAVPLAMASLLQKNIIVPPDPGLVGAFGAALEIKDKIRRRVLPETNYSLRELAGRQVEIGKFFICAGAKEHCDLGCEVNLFRVNGKNIPFGGVCNKYYNLVHHVSIDPEPLDAVAKRQELIFEKNGQAGGISIGISRSFYTHTLHPLYYNFFSQLGMKVILGDSVEPEGVKMAGSSFCFPGEIAHGMFRNLLDKNPDYIFLPHVEELFSEGNGMHGKGHQCTCVLGQSEPYYLRSAFREIRPKVLSPVLNFHRGWHSAEDKFMEIGLELGVNKKKTRAAFRYGIEKQTEFHRKKKELGSKILREIENDPAKVGVVIFGRAYNAFEDIANLGIPKKFASRGVYVIPYDCLDYDGMEVMENMNWATGQEIIKAAGIVKKHPKLFGAYITNFSCGPDSFLVGYFRDIMKTKPSLTLELDSHSADAGINTRVEAFLDIIRRYRELDIGDNTEREFRPARLKSVDGVYTYVAGDGNEYPVNDKRIRMIIPSMGKLTTELAAAAFRGLGFNAEAGPVPDTQTLMRGRANTSCKECLPLILTTASLLEAVEKRKNPSEMILYFMPTASGNCRFSQYYVFQKKIIEKQRLENVALLTLTAENNYAGLGTADQVLILKSIVAADILDDIRNALLVLPEDKEDAERVFQEQVGKIAACFEHGGEELYEILEDVADELSTIRLRYDLSVAKRILLAGEIYVRKDEFCSQEIIRRLAMRDIITKRSSVLEWLYYVDSTFWRDLKQDFNLGAWTGLFITSQIRHNVEKKIKRILAGSGLYEYELIDMDDIIKTGSKFIDPAMSGEAIVVIGSFFNEMISHVYGVVSIGPFACMPTRVIESILSRESKIAGNNRLDSIDNIEALRKFHALPFLSIEADGSPFPQIVEARLEAFSLQVERIYESVDGTP
jgi:predicted CoA-substrate-specific enzyme activase